MVLLLLGIFGYRAGEQTTVQGWIALLAFGIVIYIFGAAADLWHMPRRLEFLLSPDAQALVVVLLIFGLVVWFITKEDKTQAEGIVEKVGQWLGRKR